MYYWLYNVALHLAFPYVAGLLLMKKRLQRGLKPRFGLVGAEFEELPQPIIWVHAVSLGETVAAVPLLRSLKQLWPQGTLLVSTVTETGKEVVLRDLAGIARHCYAPLDFPWAVDRYIRSLKPSLFILIESEFWPNLLRRLHECRIPVCLVNGRISSRSYSRYRLIRGFMRKVLGYLDLALMQSDRDKRRALDLGMPPEILQVTGNMKFDQGQNRSDQESVSLFSSKQLGLRDGEWLWVAGSTHAEEEEIVLKAYRTVVETYPHLVLMLAPRHIERTAKVEKVVRDYGMHCVRRSEISSIDDSSCAGTGRRVILLDTRGELARMYQLGNVGFVGGTFVSVGGHNLLEPAQWGRPVLFGPFTDHCQDIAGLLLEGGGGVQVQDVEDLARNVMDLLGNREKAKIMGDRAFSLVQEHRGVVAQNLQMIVGFMNNHHAPWFNPVHDNQSSPAPPFLVK